MVANVADEIDAGAPLCEAPLRSSGQRAEQGGRIVASPVHHAVDEQGGGA